MDLIIGLIAIAVIVVFCVFLIKLLFGQMKWILKLAINTCMGFVLLFIINFICEFWNFSFEFNFINALIVGVLGIPGVILLLIMEFLI